MDSPEEAAACLSERAGNILLAIGAKGLPAFAGLDPTRLYPRVLPVEGESGGLPPGGIPTRNIIAMHGPFSRALNAAILEQYRIRWMVTKDGGAAGGFGEKLAAARDAGGGAGDHRPPGGDGDDLEDVLAWLLGDRASKRRREHGSDPHRHGTGDPSAPDRRRAGCFGAGGCPHRLPPSGGGLRSGAGGPEVFPTKSR